MSGFVRLILVVIVLGLGALPAEAAVPGRVAFTARVVDEGVPVEGPVEVTLHLFRAATGGTSVWTESHRVEAEQGLVSLGIGEQTPLDGSVLDGALFLEVTVDSTVLSPRLAIGSVPFALRAEQAERVGDLRPVDIQRALTGACPVGSSIRVIDPSGAVTCEQHTTLVDAGFGLTRTGDALAVDPAVIQSRVGGACPAGSSIRTIAQDGSVVCEVDSDTTYQTTCPAGQFVRAMSATGAVTCGAPAVSPLFSITSANGTVSVNLGVRSFCALTRVFTQGNPAATQCSLAANASNTWTLSATATQAPGALTICEARCL
jgi:hypothetical protein